MCGTCAAHVVQMKQIVGNMCGTCSVDTAIVWFSTARPFSINRIPVNILWILRVMFRMAIFMCETCARVVLEAQFVCAAVQPTILGTCAAHLRVIHHPENMCGTWSQSLHEK